MAPLQVPAVNRHGYPVTDHDQWQYDTSCLSHARQDQRKQADEQTVDSGNPGLCHADEHCTERCCGPLVWPDRGQVIEHRAAPAGYIAVRMMDVSVRECQVLNLYTETA